MRFAHTLGWPMGTRFFAIIAASVFGLTWFMTRDQVSWQALDWVHTSAQFAIQIRLPGLVSAAAASFVAARLTHRTRIYAQPWSPRVGLPILVRHLVQLLGWVLPAYLIGLGPLVWATMRETAVGTPDLLVIAGGLLGFVAIVALGYLIGTVIQNALAIPATLIIVFLLQSLPLVHDAWNAVIPVMSAVPTLGREQSPLLSIYRLIAFGVFGAAFCWCAVRMISRARLLNLHAAPLALVPIALMIFPFVRTPALFVHVSPGKAVCETRDGIAYCVHEGHRAQLSPLLDTAGPIIAAFGADNTGVRQLRDYALAENDEEVLSGERRGTMWIYIKPGPEPLRDFAHSIAADLVPGTARCVSQAGSIEVGASVDERRAYLLYDLISWLQTRPHPSQDTDGLFAQAHPDQVRDWITENRDALLTCTADPEDLPWR
jgi:hypothetical protein